MFVLSSVLSHRPVPENCEDQRKAWNNRTEHTALSEPPTPSIHLKRTCWRSPESESKTQASIRMFWNEDCGDITGMITRMTSLHSESMRRALLLKWLFNTLNRARQISGQHPAAQAWARRGHRAGGAVGSAPVGLSPKPMVFSLPHVGTPRWRSVYTNMALRV